MPNSNYDPSSNLRGMLLYSIFDAENELNRLAKKTFKRSRASANLLNLYLLLAGARDHDRSKLAIGSYFSFSCNRILFILDAIPRCTIDCVLKSKTRSKLAGNASFFLFLLITNDAARDYQMSTIHCCEWMIGGSAAWSVRSLFVCCNV